MSWADDLPVCALVTPGTPEETAAARRSAAQIVARTVPKEEQAEALRTVLGALGLDEGTQTRRAS